MEDEEKQQLNQEQEQDRIDKQEQLNKVLLYLKDEIGIEEIREKTHIALFKIEAILNKDYDQFDRTIAIGFVRIIEREYQVSLETWIEDFDDYRQARGLSSVDEFDNTFTDVNMKIDRYEKRTSSKWLNIAIGIIVLIVIGGYAAFNFLEFDNSEEQDVNVSGVNATMPESVLPEDNESNESIEGYDIEHDTNASEVSSNTTMSAENNLTASYPDATDINNTSTAQVLTFSVGEDVAGRQLWLGVLYVNSKRRAHQVVTGEYNLDAKEPMLFVTGHGRFSVGVNGKLSKINQSSPLYLHYAPATGIRVITDAEFRQINGGRGW